MPDAKRIMATLTDYRLSIRSIVARSACDKNVYRGFFVMATNNTDGTATDVTDVTDLDSVPAPVADVVTTAFHTAYASIADAVFPSFGVEWDSERRANIRRARMIARRDNDIKFALNRHRVYVDQFAVWAKGVNVNDATIPVAIRRHAIDARRMQIAAELAELDAIAVAAAATVSESGSDA